jgi:hypothetical protein
MTSNPNSTPTDRRLFATIDADDALAAGAALADGAHPDALHHFERAYDREQIPCKETALHRAVELGRHRIVELLLRHGADPDGRAAAPAPTPLAVAAARGDLSAVTSLLDAGASPRRTDDRDDTDPVLAAVGSGRVDVVATLLRAGAAMPRVLARAALVGNADLVAFLLDHGADLASEGPVALCDAANAGHDAVVALLLARGVPVDVRNSFDWTPLQLASYQGNTSTAALLQQAGAVPG